MSEDNVILGWSASVGVLWAVMLEFSPIANFLGSIVAMNLGFLIGSLYFLSLLALIRYIKGE